MRKINIGIDGPAGSGKGTVAKLVADKLEYLYIDSGVMYRLLTYLLIKNNVDFDNDDAIKEIMINEFDYELKGDKVYFNNEDVSDILRSKLVNEKVAIIAAKKFVREFMVDLQKNIASEKGIVMDGRDITSVVMPDAELKIFLVADLDVRVQRRYEQMIKKGEDVKLEDVKNNLAERDYYDNEINKTLVIRDDSVVIDSTYTTVEEVVDKVLSLAKEMISND